MAQLRQPSFLPALRTLLTTGLVVALLACAAHPAPLHAAPRQAPPPAAAGITGVWLVHPDPTDPTTQELVVLAPGGLMFTSNNPSTTAGPDGPPQFASQGYGLWAQQADGSYAVKFLQIEYTPDGAYADTVTIAGSVMLGADGNSFSGSYTVSVTGTDGTTMQVQPETPVTATRVTLSS
jgi:hypothetical protein